jgi:glycine hydroxymethyltransferase
MLESDIKVVAEFLHRAVQLALLIQKESGSKLLKDFVSCCFYRTGGQGGCQAGEAAEEGCEGVRYQVAAARSVDVKDLKKPAGIEEED